MFVWMWKGTTHLLTPSVRARCTADPGSTGMVATLKRSSRGAPSPKPTPRQSHKSNEAHTGDVKQVAARAISSSPQK
jgi:hypothetical protein